MTVLLQRQLKLQILFPVEHVAGCVDKLCLSFLPIPSFQFLPSKISSFQFISSFRLIYSFQYLSTFPALQQCFYSKVRFWNTNRNICLGEFIAHDQGFYNILYFSNDVNFILCRHSNGRHRCGWPLFFISCSRNNYYCCWPISSLPSNRWCRWLSQSVEYFWILHGNYRGDTSNEKTT